MDNSSDRDLDVVAPARPRGAGDGGKSFCPAFATIGTGVDLLQTLEEKQARALRPKADEA